MESQGYYITSPQFMTNVTVFIVFVYSATQVYASDPIVAHFFPLFRHFLAPL